MILMKILVFCLLVLFSPIILLGVWLMIVVGFPALLFIGFFATLASEIVKK